MNKDNSEDTERQPWYKLTFEPALENLRRKTRIESDHFVENAKTNIEGMLDTKVPFITANIRVELEKLIDNRIDSLNSSLKKIALIVFACTLPLTLGIWFLAFVLLMK